jgi:rhodanese-related sulfurtransferase
MPLLTFSVQRGASRPIAHLLLLAALVYMEAAPALDKSAVRRSWHTPFDLYLTAREAHALKSATPDQVLFVDVRTRHEVYYVGLAEQVDANIPYQFDSLEWRQKSDGIHGTFRKTRNPHFERAVEIALTARGLDKHAAVILMCTSGSRSPKAARALHKAGLSRVYVQAEGFEGIKAKSGPHKGKRLVTGWKHEGLPWSYQMPAAKMYFNFDPARLVEK